MRAIIDPGHEVIMPDPHYVAYDACVVLAGGKVVNIPTYEENSFELGADEVEAGVTGKTKALLIGYPANPTGAVMTREKMAEVAEVARRHQLMVISDEMMEYILLITHFPRMLNWENGNLRLKLKTSQES